MFGGKKRVLPNAARNRILTSRGYNLRTVAELVIKHKIPRPSRISDD
jgi:hypothetical protein